MKRFVTKMFVFAQAGNCRIFKPLILSSIIVTTLKLFPIDVYAETLFTEDFEGTPEQAIEGRCRYEGNIGTPAGACNTVPNNWDFIYTSDNNPTKPPGEILDGAGQQGKGLRVYDESYGDRNSWGHDLQLGKHFAPNQYPELWVTMWIRFNPLLNTNGLSAAKIFRMGHYNPKVIDGTTGTSVVNANKVTPEGPTTSGLMLYDIKQAFQDHYRHKVSVRGDPSYKISREFNGPQFEIKDANGDVADKSWGGTYGDGQWHKYEVGMIMNSSAGAEDGEVILYLDDVFQGGKTNIPWLQSGHDPDATGFNMFTVGGNANFIWDGQSNAEQYFYDIDNIAVCTSRCATTNPTPPPTPPSEPNGKPVIAPTLLLLDD